MKFDMEKVLHPFTPDEEKKEWEGKQGWFNDNIISRESIQNIMPKKQMNLTEDINFPYRSETGLTFRYFYPAPEKEYRPYNEKELNDLVGTKIQHIYTRDCMIVMEYKSAFNSIPSSNGGLSSGKLLKEYLHMDGSPCGVEVTE